MTEPDNNPSREEAEAVVIEVFDHSPDEGVDAQAFAWDIIEALFQTGMIALKGETRMNDDRA